MTPTDDLEIKGSFYAHPFAELLAEIAHAGLNGSMRVANGDKKYVLYFKSGRPIYAVSNERSSRLFEILIRRNRLTKADLQKVPNFSSDQDLTAFLIDNGTLSRGESDRLLGEQIEGILVGLMALSAGEWAFSTLARIRDGLAFDTAAPNMLIEYGRCLPVEKMLGRFRSLDEKFLRSDISEISFNLRPEEAFVLSRADEGSLSAAGLVSVAAMSKASALQAIYTLWLGGLLVRRDWQAAFSPAAIAAIKGVKLELKQEAKDAEAVAVVTSPDSPPPLESKPDVPISLDEYLERVEHAKTHYEILGVDIKADPAEMKRAYFGLAKMFHPDRYHAEGGMTLKRIQNAFTVLAQAHETLKSTDSREIYDYRIRKELAERELREAAGTSGDYIVQVDQAKENFERGFSLLMDKDYAAATLFLARAVHFDPKSARHHAYYGKALSFDTKQRHKAESELQAALKLDANNVTFRLLLVEFFIQNNLRKRAQGELERLLAIAPENREALQLFESLAPGSTPKPL
ncbi:MAG: DnaJ domain-containing protein [Pyrinomonadaceae bacterium]